MRADYLVRFRPYFTEGGFKRLLEGGADYQDCHYLHAVTKTAPGHATILSGVNANVHGIIANEWLDRTTFIQGNAVEDVDSPLVGLPPRLDRYANATFAAKAGRSPRNFLGTTVGDRLKARYGAAAKVFGVADKDRSAILMSGPKADGAYWTEEGRFVTSMYYRAALPAWLEQFNAERGAARHFGQVWDRLLDQSIYDAVQGPDDAPGEQSDNGMGVTFPKRVDGGKPAISGAFYSAFDQTPWNNELVADAAEQLITVEHLGEDATPDLLCIGFSQTDSAGHAYGPDSHEVMDSFLRLDRVLAEFFQFLDQRVGLAHCVIVLTADHGVSPLPERIQAAKGPAAAGRIGKDLDGYLIAATAKALGPLPDDQYWIVHDNSGYHLNPRALAAHEIPAARAEESLRAMLLAYPAIAAAYTRTQLTGSAPLDEFGEMTRLSYYPARSADVLFIEKPNFMSRAKGTTHGTPYEYDTHVPQLWFGTGVKPGVHPERVAVEDIAPTLAGLLGVDLPAAKGKKLF
jgi:predicted AlkP superfamily pyrophosphatase or phosphodiesterase